MPCENRTVNWEAAVFDKNIPTMNTSGREPGETRQGSQTGWTKQGVQVPDHLALRFREDAAELGYGGVKYLGAAAIALVLGLKRGEQRAIANYVRDKTWTDTQNLEPERVRHMIGMFMESPYDMIPQYLHASKVDISYDKAHSVWTKEEEAMRKLTAEYHENLAELGRQAKREFDEERKIRESEHDEEL